METRLTSSIKLADPVRTNSNRVVAGRFAGGRLTYALRKDIGKYIAAYRREGLNALDRKILKHIGSGADASLSGLFRKFADRQAVRESLRHLEYNMYIGRATGEHGGLQSPGAYTRLRGFGKTSPENAVKWLAGMYFRARGPATMSGLQGYTGIDRPILENAVSALEAEGIVEKAITVEKGAAPSEYYVHASDRDSLEIFACGAKPERALPDGSLQGGSSPDMRKPDDAIRILSLSDPFVQQFIPRLIARFGDGRYHAILRGADPVGIADLQKKTDRIEVRDIELERPMEAVPAGLLPDILRAVDRVMEFYRPSGHDTVMVRAVNGKTIWETDGEASEAFRSCGYRMAQRDMMVKGSVEAGCFSDETIVNYVLWKQHVHPETRFKSEGEAIRGMGGLRSDSELLLRLGPANFRPLRDLWKDGTVVHAPVIPGYSAYCTPDDLALYRRARNARLDANMRILLRMFGNRPVRRSRLLDDSPLGLGSFTNALKGLLLSLHVVKNRDGTLSMAGSVGGGLQNTVRAARKAVLRSIISQFGIFSADGLAAYTRLEFGADEVRRLLNALEREGFVSRGYFIEGDDTQHWIVREDLAMLRSGWNRPIDETLVISQDDRLSQYLSERAGRRFGLKNCHIILRNGSLTGAFRAGVKRGVLTLGEHAGDSGVMDTIRLYARSRGLVLSEGKTAADDDWDIISYVDRTRGAGDER